MSQDYAQINQVAVPALNSLTLGYCANCDQCCTFFCLDDLECVGSCSCGCCPGEVLFGPNLNVPRGQLLGQSAMDGRYYHYDPNATDGREMPKVIAKRHYHTDPNGRLLDFNIPNFGVVGCGPLTGIVWTCGEFRICDIHGDLFSALLYPNFAKIVDGFVAPHIGDLMSAASGNGIVRLL